MARTWRGAIAPFALALPLALSCRFDPAYRDAPPAPVVTCTVGAIGCQGAALARCDGDDTGQRWTTIDDCGARGYVCSPSRLACTPCAAGLARCTGQDVEVCRDDGSAFAKVTTCDTSAGKACRTGTCVDLCADADAHRSNVGCEYWPVDLDNAVVGSGNAAAQPFAVVLSNAEPDVPARVTVEVDDASPGEPAKIRIVGTAVIAPHNLEVFNLGSREVDGSLDGTYDSGTGTALTRHAFRVRSTFPIVAYQFNPFANVGVFSNDASQLLPTAALGGASGDHAYVVAGWPQTIASTDDPNTNFGQDLRAFLAIVGTQPDTHVHITSRARVIPGGPLPQGLAAGESADIVLQPFEVLNLETGGFNADFTGSIVDADRAVAVFPGSEASDAPYYSTLSERSCCADHLEEQAPPVRSAGKTYVIGRMPNRTRVLAAAGATIAPFDEPEIYRVVATRGGITTVTTSLPPPDDLFDLTGEGAVHDITAHDDFVLNATQGVVVGDIQVSQEAAGVPRGLPGGDPSLTFVPPAEQFRSDYVLLTPDKYAFDFLVLTAPTPAKLYLDGRLLDDAACEIHDTDGKTPNLRGAPHGAYLAYRCQLSFPAVDPATGALTSGRQNDGVHHVQADFPVGVEVYGFDAYVSYAYAGGTDLRDINVK